MPVLSSAEAPGISGVELLPLAKVCAEYNAMGQTRFAPISLKRCLPDREMQSSSANMCQHERNVIGWRAVAPAGDAVKNPLFHLLGRQG